MKRLPIFLLLFGLFYDTSARQLAKDQRPPNIIYIFADDLGHAELGAYGQRLIRTPNIDRLAAEGITFTRHYSGAPVCAPSRCMLMTGRHSGHSYIRGNYEMGGFEDDQEGGQMPLYEGAFTIPRMLKGQGYATALVGKWGMGMPGTTGSPLLHGFDYYYGYLDQKQAHSHYPTHLWENDMKVPLNNRYVNVHQTLDPRNATAADFEVFRGKDFAPEKMGEKALAFIENNKSRSFFLYFASTLPHLSLQVPEDFRRMYDGKFDEKPYYGGKSYAPVEHPLSTYAAMISYLDAQVGMIMDKIKVLGLDRNTIIMFSSDNGNTFDIGGVQPDFFKGSGGLRGLKMDIYEGGIRVPFIARWPGRIAEGSKSDHISAQYDILPTLADITGASVPVTDGISLLPELTGTHNRQKAHPFLYFEYPEKGGQIAVRMGRWKGVRTNVRKDRNAPWQLYDLDADPRETSDIASLHPDIIGQMRKIAEQQHVHPHIMEWEFIDPKK
jgi:arylsulfatase A-like enzyme